MSASSVSSTVIVRAENVSKKYCRNLRRSLRYGVADVWWELIGRDGEHRQRLRPGEFYAVRDISLAVAAGECVALLGPNGAGKSTMLKMLCGLIKPTAGRIEIRGRVGTLIELGTGFNPILSGRENVFVNAAVLGFRRRETAQRFDEIVEFAELAHVIDDPVRTYSSGMRVRLGFAIAANLRPHLLLIDEVLAVGDVGFRLKCFQHLQKLTGQGVAIVLVTHATGMLPRVCDRAIVFAQGKKVFDGDLQPGIAAYEQLMHVVDQRGQNRDETARTGAWIESVTIADSDGVPIEECRTGQDVDVIITLGAEEELQGARLLVAIHSATAGVVASMMSHQQRFRFRLQPPRKTIRLRLPRLPLLVGAYHFNVSLFGSGPTDFYQRRTSAATLKVVGPPEDVASQGVNGVVRLDHAWSDE
jgi:lipopolysaccharide transport system ATP-binding protein